MKRPYERPSAKFCICGKVFMPPAHLVKRGFGKVCSRRCAALSKKTRPLLDRFLDKILIGNDCWEWQGAKERAGYGHLNNRGQMVKAHKFSYEIFIGKINKGMEICHRCDNPPCVRPSHLFQGSRADNAMDAFLKGRNIPPRFVGENHPMAKLSASQADEIRKLYATGGWTHRALGERFEISHCQIGKILRGQSFVEAA